MPDAYEVFDGRFSQFRLSTSAADALETSIGPVPAGRVWTIRQAFGSCSATETQVYWFSIGVHGYHFPFTNPTSVTINATVARYHPAVTEGMEIKLFPGEYLWVTRAAATAGSTVSLFVNLVETALPLYKEYEPQIDRRIERSSARIFRRSSGYGGGGGAPSGTYGPGSSEGGGGGGTTIPI